MPCSLAQLYLDRLARWGNLPFLVYLDREDRLVRRTFRETAEDLRAWAGFLQRHGDRIRAFLAANGEEFAAKE